MIFLICSVLRQHVRTLQIIAAFTFAFASLSNPAHAGDNHDYSVIGKWQLKAALDHSEITSIDDREAQKLVGKIFTIAKDRVQFGTRKCLPPEFEAERVEPRLYLREQAHASASKLGLPNPVTVVDLDCTVVFIKAKNRLVIHWDGWFFDARRQR